MLTFSVIFPLLFQPQPWIIRAYLFYSLPSLVFCNINEHFYGYKYLKDLLHRRTNYGWLFHEIARGFDLTILLLVYIHSVAGEQDFLQSKFSNLVLLIWTIVYLSACSLNCILQVLKYQDIEIKCNLMPSVQTSLTGEWV